MENKFLIINFVNCIIVKRRCYSFESRNAIGEINYMSKEKIKYKFDFGNPFKMILSRLVEMFENISILLITWLISLFLQSSIWDLLPEGFLSTLLTQIIAIVTIIVDLFFVVLPFLPKSIVLTDDKITIYRFCIPLLTTFFDIRGLNDRISYAKIKVCEKHSNKFYYSETRAFLFNNNESLVEIRTAFKHYVFPVKNCEEFIAEVNRRIPENKDKTDK